MIPAGHVVGDVAAEVEDADVDPVASFKWSAVVIRGVASDVAPEVPACGEQAVSLIPVGGVARDVARTARQEKRTIAFVHVECIAGHITLERNAAGRGQAGN